MTSVTAAQVRVFQDLETLSRAVADFFIDLARRKISAEGRFSVALSGGETPRRLYALLGSVPYREDVVWQQVHVFWADERCVPPGDPESNYKLAFDTFLSKVPIPNISIHRVHGEEESGKAAGDYEKDLRAFFTGPAAPSFDLVILGAGEDGHTASLFPGASALRDTSRLVLPVHLQWPKRDRVTLSLPMLNHAGAVFFLASGRAKAAVVSDILEHGNTQRYPAGLVRPEKGALTWFLDKEAADNLKGNYA